VIERRRKPDVTIGQRWSQKDSIARRRLRDDRVLTANAAIVPERNKSTRGGGDMELMRRFREKLAIGRGHTDEAHTGDVQHIVSMPACRDGGRRDHGAGRNVGKSG
jgi:hypothetical protein